MVTATLPEMKSQATTVAAYLDELPPNRRHAVEQVLDEVRAHLPEGYAEQMGFGMITWVVPLEVFPDTYNRAPLMYAALASQQNYISLYLMSLYAGDAMTEEAFRSRWSGGRRLDMGKSCVRFRSADDLDLDLIGEAVSLWTPEQFVDLYRASRAGR